jgi:hypothetical protein
MPDGVMVFMAEKALNDMLAFFLLLLCIILSLQMG